MSFIYSSISKACSSKIPEILPKVLNSRTSKGIINVPQKFVLSPYEAFLTAQVYNKRNSISFPVPTSVILPTLEKNKGITFSVPVTKPLMKEPLLNVLEKFDPLSSLVIEEGPSEVLRKEAVNMIIIRRRKMKKHKLRKLRKRMRFYWVKRNQKREYKKEKIFQASQMDKIREAHAFDPVAHVNEIIRKTKEKPFPKTWKGKRLPQAVIKILIENDGKYIPPKPSS